MVSLGKVAPFTRGRSCPFSLGFWELVLGEAGESGHLAFPLHLQPSWRKPAKLSWKESLFRILTFF